MSGEISFGLCCCSCRAIGNVLVWGFVTGSELFISQLQSMGATVDVIVTAPGSNAGTFPADISDYQMIFVMSMSSSVDASDLFAAGDIAAISAWFNTGCKRLVLVSDNTPFQGITNPSRNDLLDAIDSSIRYDVDRTVNVIDSGNPGNIISHPFTTGVSSIGHVGVGGLVVTGDATAIVFTTDLLDGATVPFVATERISRSSLIVTADWNMIQNDAFFGGNDNGQFIENLFSVSVDDA